MIEYDKLEFHPAVEEIVTAICDRTGQSDRSFFRNHVSYYLACVASCMRTNYLFPGAKPETVNMYAINLAYSNFGKSYATSIIEGEVIGDFRTKFSDKTLPLIAEKNFPKVGVKRAAKRGTDPDTETDAARNQFEREGEYVFSYDEATTAAIKQLRGQLLLANAGSLNLIVDEIAANLSKLRESLAVYLELYNGQTKNKLVKNTADNKRNIEIFGKTPSNMMLFGLPKPLFNCGREEEEFISMLTQGYARRCFFAYVPERLEADQKVLTPEEQLALRMSNQSNTVLDKHNARIGKLADSIHAHKTLVVPEDTALLYFQYQNDCNTRLKDFRKSEELLQSEMSDRPAKAIKVAGAYAFYDQSGDITVDHLAQAIALAEASGTAFANMLNQPRPYVRLAEHIAHEPEELTQADLVEDLSFYKGSKGQKDEMMVQAIAWGYKNNILIKRKFVDSIEFFRGETLKATNLNQMRVAWGQELAFNYQNEIAPFEDLHKLTNQAGLNWINHHVVDGHRHETAITAGFNMIVLDIDSSEQNNLTFEAVKKVFAGYKALYYTTKSHTNDHHRFRVILPTNFELTLDREDYKEFMKNVFEALPFTSDEQTGQRARKWLSHNGYHEYTDGSLFDVLPFIPKTSKNEERKKSFSDLRSLDNLERWVIQNTGDGNRNNQLLRYALILVDSGRDFQDIQHAVFAMNDKLVDKLDEAEITATVMKTVSSKLQLQEAA